jgi:hypothetical protein
MKKCHLIVKTTGKITFGPGDIIASNKKARNYAGFKL